MRFSLHIRTQCTQLRRKIKTWVRFRHVVAWLAMRMCDETAVLNLEHVQASMPSPKHSKTYNHHQYSEKHACTRRKNKPFVFVLRRVDCLVSFASFSQQQMTQRLPCLLRNVTGKRRCWHAVALKARIHASMRHIYVAFWRSPISESNK